MRYRVGTPNMEHQTRALRFLIRKRGVGALLMDPGTGKSKVVVDYTGVHTAKYESMRVLILAPLSALDTWVEQYQQHLGVWVDDEGNEYPIPTQVHVLNSGSIEERAAYLASIPEFDGLQVAVVNHDLLKYRHPAKGKDGRELATVTVRDRAIKAIIDNFQPDLVVLDEMHRAKTHSSNLSTACAKIGKHTFLRIGMTGTVAPHSTLDFYGQWKFVNPLRLPSRWDDFRYMFAVWGGFEGREVLGFIRQKELRKLIRQDAFVVKKRDCLDLPPVSDIAVPVRLESEARYYIDMAEELIVELPSGAKSISRSTLTKMLRLRQITGGVVGYRHEGVGADGKPRTVSRTEDVGDAKLRRLLDKVSTIVDAGEKQVIFAHFRRDIERIAEACRRQFRKKQGVPVYVMDGGTKDRDRKAQRKEFASHEGPAIFVAQIRTVSLAINELVVANYGHFYSYSQLRDDYEQARDRLDRKGQTSPVTFYHYLVPDSIDTLIYQAHKEKKKLENAITVRKARKALTLGKGR